MNAHLRSIFEQEGEPKENMGGAVPGSGDDVGGEGPTVASALGTGIQIPGCVGSVRYGARISPGLVGMIEGCQRVWARGQEGLAQPAAQGLCAGNRCQQWHLWGKVASVAASVFRWLSGFVLRVTSTLRAGCKCGVGMKTTVPPACFGFAGELKTHEHCPAASWEASPQVAWQRWYHALKPEVDLGWVF